VLLVIFMSTSPKKGDFSERPAVAAAVAAAGGERKSLAKQLAETEGMPFAPFGIHFHKGPQNAFHILQRNCAAHPHRTVPLFFFFFLFCLPCHMLTPGSSLLGRL
jgi:hypothetical protein